MGEGGFSESAADKTGAGKIRHRERYIGKINIDGIVIRGDSSDKGFDSILRLRVMESTQGASRKGVFLAARNAAGQPTIHDHRLHYRRLPGKGGGGRHPCPANSGFCLRLNLVALWV